LSASVVLGHCCRADSCARRLLVVASVAAQITEYVVASPPRRHGCAGGRYHDDGVKVTFQVVVFDAADLAAEISFCAGVLGGTVDPEGAWHMVAGRRSNADRSAVGTKPCAARLARTARRSRSTSTAGFDAAGRGFESCRGTLPGDTACRGQCRGRCGPVARRFTIGRNQALRGSAGAQPRATSSHHGPVGYGEG